MKKTLLSCMTVCMALTAMSSHAQALQQKRAQLQQLAVPAQLVKANAISMEMKGEPAVKPVYEVPAFLQNADRTASITSARKSGIRFADNAGDSYLYATVLSNEDWPMEQAIDMSTGEPAFDENGQPIMMQNPKYDLYTWDGEELKALGTDPELGITSLMIANGGGAIAGNEYIFNYYQYMWGSLAYNYFLAYDLTKDRSAEDLLMGGSYYDDHTIIATQTAFDATTGQIYGQFKNEKGDGYVWGTRDIYDGHTTVINPKSSITFLALAFDNLGRAWAVNAQKQLVSIDKNSGFYTVVGNIGINGLSTNMVSTGAIDPRDNTFYFFGHVAESISLDDMNQDTKAVLYTIDLTTGKATKVKDMPGNAHLAGAAFRPLVYAEATPAAAQNLVLDFDKDALNGTLSFAAPAKTVGGAALAEAELTVTLDGEVLKTMSCTAGQEVTIDVAVEEAGIHVIQVTAANEAGAGEPATIQKWVGLDVPVAVTDLKIENTDYNHATISWTAPTVGIHGGYIDPAQINYTVTNSDGETETTGLTDTKLAVEKEGTKLSTRSYSVTAYCGENPGLTADTERIYYGNPKAAPTTFDFASQTEFNLWTVLDANKDYITWNYDFYGQCAKNSYTKYIEVDDYLFSPPIHLEADKVYNLKSEIAAKMTYYKQAFEILLTKKQSVDGVVKTLQSRFETVKDGKEEAKFYTLNNPITVDEEGDYYIAYHDISPANQLELQVHRVQVERGTTDLIPAAAEATITAGEQGKHEATVNFTVPTTDCKGRPVVDLWKAELYHEGKTLVGKIEDIEAGKSYSITDDKEATSGTNNYTLYIYNDEGKGLPTNLSVFIGHDLPTEPLSSDVIVENDEVRITWEAPSSVGKNGGYVDTKKLEYTVARQLPEVELTYVGYDMECYDESYPWNGNQQQIYYGVFAKNSVGMGAGLQTPTAIAGDAYLLPSTTTFGEHSESTLWVAGYHPEYRVSITMSNDQSYDEDGGCIAFTNYAAVRGMNDLSSGRYFIPRDGYTTLTFAVTSNGNGNTVKLKATTDGVIEHAKEVETYSVTKDEWTLCTYDLSAYAGKEVLLDFEGSVGGDKVLYLDTVSLTNVVPEGIDSVISNAAAATYYDLSGRQSVTNKGVVISNNKKIIK